MALSCRPGHDATRSNQRTSRTSVLGTRGFRHPTGVGEIRGPIYFKSYSKCWNLLAFGSSSGSTIKAAKTLIWIQSIDRFKYPSYSTWLLFQQRQSRMPCCAPRVPDRIYPVHPSNKRSPTTVHILMTLGYSKSASFKMFWLNGPLFDPWSMFFDAEKACHANAWLRKHLVTN